MNERKRHIMYKNERKEERKKDIMSKNERKKDK